MKYLWFLMPFALVAKEAELFVDWLSMAKGDTLFKYQEEENLSLLPQIAKELKGLDWKIESFEKEKYLPWIHSTKSIQSFRDLCHYLKVGISTKLPEKDLRIFWGLGPTLQKHSLERLGKEKQVLFIWEPPVVQPEGYTQQWQAQFNKIFTWNDALVDNKKFFKFHYPVLTPRIQEVVPFEEKRFCTLIATRLSSKHPKELYSARERTIRFFEDKEGEFDLYGRHWEKRGYRNWKGPVPDKIETLKHYKYCICYENTQKIKGYITEKIFDCFTAGVVPVYWGASNVEAYIPKSCFIDRRLFVSEEALYEHLHQITKEEYEAYLTAAENYLQSEQAQIFSVKHFIEIFKTIFVSPNAV